MPQVKIVTAIQPPSYERHQPKQTLLYQLVEQRCLVFKTTHGVQEQSLPLFIVRQKHDDFLQRCRLEYGFLRVRSEGCHNESLVSFKNTTHVVFELLGFIAKIAALVPEVRNNLTLFHGVFTPNNKHQAIGKILDVEEWVGN